MLSLIFLAYNDCKSLEENLHGWLTAAEQVAGKDYEIIIADDGSNDNTETFVRKVAELNDKVRLVKNNVNQGVGANFRNGVLHAKGNTIVYTDGDGQYLPSDLPVLIQQIPGFDMVNGKREKRADPLIRGIASYIYNMLVKLIYDVSVDDINSGLKVFRKSYIDCCMPQLSDGPFFDAEFLIKGNKNGMKIKEIPINHQPRKYGAAAGISRKSIQFLFKELCQKDMQCYIRKNQFSKFLFKALSLRSIAN